MTWQQCECQKPSLNFSVLHVKVITKALPAKFEHHAFSLSLTTLRCYELQVAMLGIRGANLGGDFFAPNNRRDQGVSFRFLKKPHLLKYSRKVLRLALFFLKPRTQVGALSK